MDGVESIGRFVEDKQFGLVDECISEADALAVAFGEGFDNFPTDFEEAAGIDYMGNALACFCT